MECLKGVPGVFRRILGAFGTSKMAPKSVNKSSNKCNKTKKHEYIFGVYLEACAAKILPKPEQVAFLQTAALRTNWFSTPTGTSNITPGHTKIAPRNDQQLRRFFISMQKVLDASVEDDAGLAPVLWTSRDARGGKRKGQ